MNEQAEWVGPNGRLYSAGAIDIIVNQIVKLKEYDPFVNGQRIILTHVPGFISEFLDYEEVIQLAIKNKRFTKYWLYPVDMSPPKLRYSDEWHWVSDKEYKL